MTVPVTVYTSPGCPGCTLTKRHLDKLITNGADIAYTEQPLDDYDREAAIELGMSTAPVVCADTPAGPQTWDGYRPDRLDALKAIA